ncbi:MAG: penicillin-binding protein 2 [Vicinamibacterales bacterium]
MAIAEDRRRLTSRLTVLTVCIAVGFGLLAGSFWFLQVVQHAQFKEMAENNHQRTLTLRAPRGIVYDRNGKLLVENRNSFNISIVREHTKDLDRTVRVLAQVAGVDEKAVREVVDKHRREPSYRPIVVIQDATLAQVAGVTARRLDFELPDVIVQEVPTRQYLDQMAAHVFGYVSEANDKDVAEDESLRSGDIVGQSGLEKIYNDLLMGTDGAKRVVVNSVGREIRVLDEEPPVQGKRLQLTLDLDLQKALEDGFRTSGYNGASVILDPRSGEVLAFSSAPAYDPNAFATGIARSTWASLITDPLLPLQDRAIQGRYPAGSTFKMAVGVAALEEGVITPDFKVYCPGHGVFYGRSFACSLPNGRGHGVMDLRQAIERSCNVYFYTIGNMLGIDKIHKWATLLGLGEKTGIDLPNEVQGLVPSPEWKRANTKNHEKWYAGETISVSIGQGAVALTPISEAVYIAALANGGTHITPHLLKAVDEGAGWQPFAKPTPKPSVTLKPQTIQAIHDGLWMVVNGSGTGSRARINGYDISGKTGTAQVISNEGARAAKGKTDKDLRDNGWFVFFAPRDNPEIAGAVMVEHGGHGGVTAAPIARHVLDTYFSKRDNRPLPAPPVKVGDTIGPAPLVKPTEKPATTPAAGGPGGTP